ncbi:MAG: tRNA pseudouridine(55) synthase TruB [Hamadaea sp.]|uniref:tRNA pseudouridine(55) synthase TruB n=1 Tax=Hamadaea sp. TaxID=2024425 RepID=UPI0018412DE4|nr:tRNA pseudouridine(55) synthase TruB [Hamadaea sp.]NUR73532.1 tRNA pseudouridine(55) synthase TruB [Hamadaea sp.]NUT19769.1 tRNA pseudouridine(55) synthase TruB [Hamadaea sp.]
MAEHQVTDGLIVVDKAPGMTSHDVVARCRRIARTRKVGHGGTLDPMATGVLVIGVGKATRLLTYVVGTRKIYRATIRLGQTTVTDDAEGEVTASVPAAHLSDQLVRTQLSTMTGEVDQVPSAVSAIKVNGVRAYKMVRDGEAPELAARRVTIERIDVFDVRTDGDFVDVDVEVACSAGTYIRAIARDLGVALGVGGHLTALRRTAVGGFTLDEAYPLEKLADLAEAGGDPVTLPLAAALRRAMPIREVDEAAAKVLSHGRPLEPIGLDGSYGVLGPDGTPLAVVSERGGKARPEIVLAAA